jgi:hypothetical protein
MSKKKILKNSEAVAAADAFGRIDIHVFPLIGLL